MKRRSLTTVAFFCGNTNSKNLVALPWNTTARVWLGFVFVASEATNEVELVVMMKDMTSVECAWSEVTPKRISD